MQQSTLMLRPSATSRGRNRSASHRSDVADDESLTKGKGSPRSWRWRCRRLPRFFLCSRRLPLRLPHMSPARSRLALCAFSVVYIFVLAWDGTHRHPRGEKATALPPDLRATARRRPTFIRHPLQVRCVYNASAGSQNTIVERIPPSTKDVSRRDMNGTEPYPLLPTGDAANEPNSALDRYTGPRCKPAYDWQLSTRPNCNRFHEISASDGDLTFVGMGGSRVALGLRDPDGSSPPSAVLKVVRWGNRMWKKFVEQQRMDGLVMEAMTASPYVVSSFGYCALSVLSEYSDGGTLYDLVKEARKKGESPLENIDKLKVGYQIAKSVADLHGNVGEGRPPLFAHNDICCHQYILLDGIFKMNDFNYADIARIDKKTGGQCLEKVNMHLWRGRGLEEFGGGDERARYYLKIKRDKVDVWMMGNLMYYVLTDLYVYEGDSEEEAYKKMFAGIQPPFPQRVLGGGDPAELALMEGIRMCWTFETDERPGAREIAEYLMGALREISGNVDTVVRANIPSRDQSVMVLDDDFDRWNP